MRNGGKTSVREEVVEQSNDPYEKNKEANDQEDRNVKERWEQFKQLRDKENDEDISDCYCV